MEKDEVDMRWYDILLEFFLKKSIEKDDKKWNDVTYLYIEIIEINDLYWIVEI
jgi:hypothetical protein